MNNERNFKGVWIPKEIWLDDRLSPLDKIMLVEIDSLDNEKGCFKSNKKFAEFMQCGVNTITRSINKLTELGYISCRMETNERGTLRIIKMVEGVAPKWVNPPHQNGEQGNTDRGKTKEKDNIKEVLEHLNNKMGTKFRTAKGLKSRFAEGFTVEDAKKVIDIKFAEWIGDEKMKQYIRPVTLFSNKMDQYLNQEVKVEKPESRDLAADYFNS